MWRNTNYVQSSLSFQTDHRSNYNHQQQPLQTVNEYNNKRNSSNVNTLPTLDNQKCFNGFTHLDCKYFYVL